MAYLECDFRREWLDGAPYIVAHTSGSTGTPKEIRLLKADMVSSARATNAFFGIGPDSVLALPLSLDYIAGKMMAVRAYEAGCRLLELPVSNRVEVAGPVDLLSVVPTQLDSLLADPEAPRKVRNLLIGGAPMTPAQEKAVARSGITAWLGYGMTETCSHVALRRVGEDTVFHAMDGVSFDIDARGCLAVVSDRFSWGQLATNDVVELLSPTSFRWLGRVDNVVNSGGLKLHPEQLEELYRRAVPGLPPFFLAGEPDEQLGSRLVMITEGKDFDVDVLRRAIADHRILPKHIIYVDRLQRNPNGKLIRKI